MPADHEAQSQVKEKRRSSCRSEGAQSKPHPKKDDTAKFKIVGVATRVHDRETCREVACESDKRHRDTSFSQRSQRNSGIKYHTVVLDHAVGGPQENRETRGSRTTQCQSIPESFLEVSRPSCGKLPHWHRSSDYAVAEYYTTVLE